MLRHKKSSVFWGLIFVLAIETGCSRLPTLARRGWSIQVDPQKEEIQIRQRDLGVVLEQGTLHLNRNGKRITLTDWEVRRKDNAELTVVTHKPEKTTWYFLITAGGVNIDSRARGAVFCGVAPASGERIPARVASQDNGILFTSLGFVSARNITRLFDRLTDILIRFPDGSSLTRNHLHPDKMDVCFPLWPYRGPKGGNGINRAGQRNHPDAEISLIRDYYVKAVGLKHYVPYWPQFPHAHPFQRAATGWLSWYCYYMPANEEDMVAETDALAKKLKAYGLEYVQLDAAFTGGPEANWLEWNKQKFPHGGKWLMQYIQKKGLKPGLWVNTMGANYAHPAFGKNFPGGRYPENWFLHDQSGHVIYACCTADTTVVRLDYSNPDVLEKHLKPLFKTLVDDWGVTYLKDAGHARWCFTFEANRARAFNPAAEGCDLYWKAQRAVREIMGPKNWILGCDAQGGAADYSRGFGLFDSAFNTQHDVYDRWKEVRRRLATLFSANYLNDIVLYNDPDALTVRPPLSRDEAITNVSSTALTGQAYILSDFIAQPSPERTAVLREHTRWGREFPDLIQALSAERLELCRKTMPALDITPIDLFPYRSKAEFGPLPEGYPSTQNFPRGLDLKVAAASGTYDVLSVYNWDDTAQPKEIRFFTDLGLDSTKIYLAFDFWNERLVGNFEKGIRVDVPPHGARVLVLRQMKNRPQLLTTSRHITGAYSIQKLAWDKKNSILSGRSKTVPNDIYSLFVFVPDGFRFRSVKAEGTSATAQQGENGVLRISFPGKKQPIDWEIHFERTL